MASIHSLIIHQKDMKTAFLKGDLEEEVYMNQPLDFIMLAMKTRKFDASGKGVIICLYVDDMLIFGTDQVQVDLTKEFLSSRFSMKDMGEAAVILGIKIKHVSNGIVISQSHYIEKVLKKFNYSDCTPVSTPLDTCEKLMPNRGSNPGTQHRQAIQRVLKYLKKIMEYRLASKKQTCVTGSTMKSEFVALAAAGKEAKWLKKLLLEIPL
nr:hypothetical protein [Tanacetum cinerariifolium]